MINLVKKRNETLFLQQHIYELMPYKDTKILKYIYKYKLQIFVLKYLNIRHQQRRHPSRSSAASQERFLWSAS